MKKIIILRGISGSGKSTYAQQLVKYNPKSIIVSADDYFKKNNGIYKFDPRKLSEAHEACYNKFLDAIQDPNIELIIVDNTNTKIDEAGKYYILCWTAPDRYCEIHEIECDIETAQKRCIHNVPLRTIQRQFDRIQKPFPWKESEKYSYKKIKNT